MSNILKKFPNLKIISRDRGVQYRSLSGSYQHIADRFHLLTNLTETMITELKKIIPREIKISINMKKLKIILLNFQIIASP